MTSRVANRRRQRRFSFPRELDAVLEFRHESAGNETLRMPLRDVSGAGLSFSVEQDLPGLDIGDCLDRVTLRLGESSIMGDLLVMHLSPDSNLGSICGGLFYPDSDAGIRALQEFLKQAARVV
ncbi:MAG: hypothetical protein OEQ13_08280 [Acidobacteriota bacterium]|nr:hypothetical protein [Acidobacteriota bacterium]